MGRRSGAFAYFECVGRRKFAEQPVRFSSERSAAVCLLLIVSHDEAFLKAVGGARRLTLR